MHVTSRLLIEELGCNCAFSPAKSQLLVNQAGIRVNSNSESTVEGTSFLAHILHSGLHYVDEGKSERLELVILR